MIHQYPPAGTFVVPAVARKGIVRLHLEDRPWDVKELYVGDPDGSLLKFGQPSFGV